MTYHVIFQGIVPPTRSELGAKFYVTLLPLLHKSPGFISETPFASTTDPNGQVEVAAFADAEAMNTWRLQKTHLGIERTGREKVFDSYRIRVGPKIDGSEEGERQVLVLYQRSTEGTAADETAAASVKELTSKGGLDEKLWSSLNDEGKYQSEKTMLWLSSWKDDASAGQFEKAIPRVDGDSVYRVKVVRDYGKDDRREAPGTENEEVEPAAED